MFHNPSRKNLSTTRTSPRTSDIPSRLTTVILICDVTSPTITDYPCSMRKISTKKSGKWLYDVCAVIIYYSTSI